MLVDMEEIYIIKSKLSNVTILHLNSFISTALALVIGIISFIGISIKVLFMYYVKYKAPKDRPINKMIFFDQVRRSGIYINKPEQAITISLNY